MNVMAEEFGAPYTKAATHSRYTLPLTLRATLEADLAALPFEVVFFERGVYDMGSSFGVEMAQRGVAEAAEIGGLPSWSVLLRRCPAAGCAVDSKEL